MLDDILGSSDGDVGSSGRIFVSNLFLLPLCGRTGFRLALVVNGSSDGDVSFLLRLRGRNGFRLALVVNHSLDHTFLRESSGCALSFRIHGGGYTEGNDSMEYDDDDVSPSDNL